MDARMKERLELVAQGCQKWLTRLPDLKNGQTFRKAMVMDVEHRAAYCWNAKASEIPGKISLNA